MNEQSEPGRQISLPSPQPVPTGLRLEVQHDQSGTPWVVAQFIQPNGTMTLVVDADEFKQLAEQMLAHALKAKKTLHAVPPSVSLPNLRSV